MKKILLGLLFICTIVDASSASLSDEERTSPRKSATTSQAVTAGDLIQMHQYFKSTYYPLIKGLREAGRITRDDVLNAYSRDPFLGRIHDGGHGTFKHKMLPITFGVSAHQKGTVNPDERKDLHQRIQVYVNVIGNFCFKFLNIHEAIAALDTMSAAEWKKAYGTKFNELVLAFNKMTPANWNDLLNAEEAVFKDLSKN
jgi:hypothetical protein